MPQSMSVSSSFGNQSGSSQSSYGTAYNPQSTARLNELYPYIRQQLPTSAQTNFGGLLGSVGGPTQKLPGITVGGVYTTQQTQEAINRGLSTADQMTGANGSGLQQARANLGGQGLGANAGQFQARQNALAGQNLQAHLSIPSTERFNEAQANATQRLQSEQAALTGAQAQSQQDIQRRQLALQAQQQLFGQQAALLQSLYAYNQPLPFGQSSSSNQGRQGSSSYSISGESAPLSIANGGLSGA